EPAAGVAHALKELGELDQAEVCYAELTDRFPAQAVGWIEHARIAVHQKRWADARERWQAAAERFPERLLPAYGFARALELLGDLEQAEAHYAELTNRFPAHAEGWIGYARIAESQKRWADA
ncbi:tetratricopeptide repeat protein, partial [Lamprobacter modestohalophilus]|uniref:tetratricopeptide repeat protein n=1 Tax=Lamprobacter modestohalophilus TaxID=1064514 RepID=UPI002ADEAA55